MKERQNDTAKQINKQANEQTKPKQRTDQTDSLHGPLPLAFCITKVKPPITAILNHTDHPQDFADNA